MSKTGGRILQKKKENNIGIITKICHNIIHSQNHKSSIARRRGMIGRKKIRTFF